MLIIWVRYVDNLGAAILYVDRPSGEILHREYYSAYYDDWIVGGNTPETFQQYMNSGVAGETYEVLVVV